MGTNAGGNTCFVDISFRTLAPAIGVSEINVLLPHLLEVDRTRLKRFAQTLSIFSLPSPTCGNERDGMGCYTDWAKERKRTQIISPLLPSFDQRGDREGRPATTRMEREERKRP